MEEIPAKRTALLFHWALQRERTKKKKNEALSFLWYFVVLFCFYKSLFCFLSHSREGKETKGQKQIYRKGQNAKRFSLHKGDIVYTCNNKTKEEKNVKSDVEKYAAKYSSNFNGQLFHYSQRRIMARASIRFQISQTCVC